MSWSPSGMWKRDFRAALKDCFSLQDMVLLTGDYFDVNFANISINPFGSSYPFLLQELIEKARREGWLVDLVAAAHERRPNDTTIRGFAEELGLTVTGPRIDNSLDTPFEEIIKEHAQFIDFATFLEAAIRLQGQICWVDIPQGGGTGFLVGPDLVLTNYHVVKRLQENKARPADVRCRFDYKEALDGSALKRRGVTEVKLHDKEWLVDHAGTSEFDWTPDLGDAEADRLDYALLRLDTAVGNEPVGGKTDDFEAPERGWVDTAPEAAPLVAGNQLIMLQHPQEQPLQMAVGEVTAYNGNQTRVRYSVNSKDGSSGSPCFNADLQLVALHHAFDPLQRPPRWNQGIPFSLIRETWEKRQISVP